MASFSSGSDRVGESDLADVRKVLAGPSKWQAYIAPNLKIANAHKLTFEVLETPDYLARTHEDPKTAGVTYKETGHIVMKQWGAKGKSYLSAVLHEYVHWVSAPAEQGAPSTAMKEMGPGLLEGLVECITLDILYTQGIGFAPEGMRGHMDRVPIVRELMKTAGVGLFARPLFLGDTTQFKMVMEFVYSKEGFVNIKNFAAGGHTSLALAEIAKRRKMEEDRRRTRDTIHMLARDNGSLLRWLLRMP